MNGNRFSHRSGLLVLLLVLIVPAVVCAGHKLTSVVHTDSMQVAGQTIPAQNDTTVTWLAKDMARADQGDTMSFIVRADQDKLFMIDHIRKEYVEMPLIGLHGMMEQMALEQAGGDKEAADLILKQMKSMMQMKITVTPANETKKIKEWNCHKYNIDLQIGQGGATIETWTTEDIKADWEMYSRISHAAMAQIPGFGEAMEEMKKIKGAIVSQVVVLEMMGQRMTSHNNLISVEEGTPPVGHFDLPKDYKAIKGGGSFGG